MLPKNYSFVNHIREVNDKHFGFWIIKGLHLLKSKEFSLDSNANVYLFVYLFLEAPASSTEQY